jgi:NADH-quinone oxidoreductase subunit L
MVAFEHNIVLWVIASLASLMTAFYVPFVILTFFNEFRTAEQESHYMKVRH